MVYKTGGQHTFVIFISKHIKVLGEVGFSTGDEKKTW